MKDNEIDREALLRVANHVRPALASQPYIPALTHFRFSSGRLLACNDVAAISVACDETAFDRLVPGALLISALSSFPGASVLVQPGEGFVLLSSGRSKVKVPTLPAADYPFSMPDAKDAPAGAAEAFLGKTSLQAISRCLMSVGADGKRPEQMGVTMEQGDDGTLVFYSTDNYTMSRATTADKGKLPGGVPVILPTFLCEQVVRLSAAFKEDEVDLAVYPGGVLASVGKHARVFSKTLVDLEPLDFPKVFGKMVGSDKELREAMAAIPEGFDSAVDRALMVLPGETAKGTLIVPGDGVFSMRSEGAMGEADDRLRFDGEGDDSPRRADPSHLARAAKSCTRMAFMPRCVAMASDDGAFVHLVSHIAG